MVITYRLAHRPGTAVHHQPETMLFIALELHEVIPAPERAELHKAVALSNRLQARMAEWSLLQRCRQRRWLRMTRMLDRWHGLIQPGQQLSGRQFVRD